MKTPNTARTTLRKLRGLVMCAGFALAGCNFITGDLEDDPEANADGALTGADGGETGQGGSGTDGAGEDPAAPGDDGLDTDGADDDGEGTGADTGAGTTGPSGGGDPGGACCFGQGAGIAECGDPGIEACVCQFDSFCCEEVWDSDCAAKVTEFGCGFCGDDNGGPPELQDNCCAPHGEAGCEDTTIETCVCNIDASCCDEAWDSLCVDLVSDGNCGDCGDDPDAQPCCSPSAQPGCDADSEVEQCVCDAAPECCSGPWTETCTQIATVTGCAQCGPYTPQELDCCGHGVGPGCSDDPVEACVCAQDPYCCSVLWDDTCVAKVEDLACGVCT